MRPRRQHTDLDAAAQLIEQEDALDAVGAALVSLVRAMILAGVRPRDLRQLVEMAIAAKA